MKIPSCNQFTFLFLCESKFVFYILALFLYNETSLSHEHMFWKLHYHTFDLEQKHLNIAYFEGTTWNLCNTIKQSQLQAQKRAGSKKYCWQHCWPEYREQHNMLISKVTVYISIGIYTIYKGWKQQLRNVVALLLY